MMSETEAGVINRRVETRMVFSSIDPKDWRGQSQRSNIRGQEGERKVIDDGLIGWG